MNRINRAMVQALSLSLLSGVLGGFLGGFFPHLEVHPNQQLASRSSPGKIPVKLLLVVITMTLTSNTSIN